jgi:hypothetical protein
MTPANQQQSATSKKIYPVWDTVDPLLRLEELLHGDPFSLQTTGLLSGSAMIALPVATSAQPLSVQNK